MIGNALFRVLSRSVYLEVFGTLRSENGKRFFSADIAKNLVCNVDVSNHDATLQIIVGLRPEVVINCIGITKHLQASKDPVVSIAINALLPHRLAILCDAINARLIHVSTDCIFSGLTGPYVEDSPSDAIDLYGKSKFLGEVTGSHVLTLRTSTIGHELDSCLGLLEWFLSQETSCTGYQRAIFSGLPSNVFAEIVRDQVLSRPDLCGLYHVGASAINKYELLCMIAQVYGKSISITRENSFVMDRSFSSERFKQATGYFAPAWIELIQSMHSFR